MQYNFFGGFVERGFLRGRYRHPAFQLARLTIEESEVRIDPRSRNFRWLVPTWTVSRSRNSRAFAIGAPDWHLVFRFVFHQR